MSIAVEVSLLSGKAATVQAGWDDQVNALRLQALIALGVSNGRLVDSSGGVLDGSAPIKDSNIQNGDTFTLHVFKAQVQGNNSALAAILGDGSVVSWGDTANFRGGAVQDQLKNVQQIQTSVEAFAAILSDRSVVTWGYAYCGGDSGAVQDQLKNVLQLQAGYRAFAAILGDGSVVTWGDADCGGDSSAVREQLKNVRQIQASQCAFGAILDNGSVVTWGYGADGGDSSGVQDQLKNVQQIQTNDCAFAAILGDGSVVTWGDADFGGDSSHVQDQLKNVQRIQASCTAFAAILDDGWVVTWGDPAEGGDSSSVQDQLKNVQQIQTNNCAFAAILGDGCVVTWGDDECGGDSRAVQEQLKNVQQIQTSCSAFAAILDDGSVVTWGRDHQGGDSRAVKDQLKNVRHIQASRFAFAAILGDGAVVTWGDAAYGGDSSAVQDQLKNVQEIQAGHRAFAAILGDGSVVTWGDPFRGGDSGAVHAQEQYSRLMEGAQRNDVQVFVGQVYEKGLKIKVLAATSYGASPELLGEESELCSQLASRGRRVGRELKGSGPLAADLASARQAVEGVDGGGGGQAPRGGLGAKAADGTCAVPKTALMWAARHGLADMVRLLGTANADVNLRSALEGSDRCLLAADASIEERSIQGQTPLHVAAALEVPVDVSGSLTRATCEYFCCITVVLPADAAASLGAREKLGELHLEASDSELPELPIRLENENPVIQEARHEIRKKEGNGSELTEAKLQNCSIYPILAASYRALCENFVPTLPIDVKAAAALALFGRSYPKLGASARQLNKALPAPELDESDTIEGTTATWHMQDRPRMPQRAVLSAPKLPLSIHAREMHGFFASSTILSFCMCIGLSKMAEAPEDPAEGLDETVYVRGSVDKSVATLQDGLGLETPACKTSAENRAADVDTPGELIVSLTGSRKNSREAAELKIYGRAVREPPKASATGTRALSSTDEASNDGSFSTKEETAFKEEDTGDKGMTVLHYAVAAGSRSFKTSPQLFKASNLIPQIRWEGHFRVLSKLVELKALLRQRFRPGLTSTQLSKVQQVWANCNAKEKNGRTPLMQAAAVGYAEAVERMLRDPSTKVADKAADHAASQHIQMMIERAMVQDRTGQPRKSLDFQDRSQLFPTAMALASVPVFSNNARATETVHKIDLPSSSTLPQDTTDKEDGEVANKNIGGGADQSAIGRTQIRALENKIQVLLKKVVVRPVHMEVLFLSIVKLIQSIARIVAASVLPCPRRELWMFDLIVSRSSEKALELDGLEVPKS
ncbi:putative E3 ubiquitin-protein ligase HERC2 [Symbiodinium microadriaticum]|uniref:Putative E3 ubiquitin-protein ligase HERC2 n=1 Tax=Symbiodinium microadriaticum TaxID=2951 RepID=A0A1Q9DJD3_SYMMI|nr:putative E3 ubiquitin-protein ligase HERC2 [Symbiodinium microadriaticum]